MIDRETRMGRLEIVARACLGLVADDHWMLMTYQLDHDVIQDYVSYAKSR